MNAPAQAILELLVDPRSYPDETATVEQLATHISWVFLTDHFAYKLKKPVRYDFLDFSSVEKRHVACQNEVRLNRRLAPDVYLGVLPITQDPQGNLALGPRPGAEAIDWVVHMRRLPHDQSLEYLIRSARLQDAQVNELAEMLAHFYRHLPPLNISAETYRQRIASHIEGNYRELSAWAGQQPEHLNIVKQLNGAQLRVLRLAPELLDHRVRDGRLVEGHGDLRPDHIYFHPGPIAMDCIEFNDELRQLDILDELAFLAIECDRLGAQWLGQKIIESYRRISGDEFSPTLLDFYRIYRCCVRAKVAVLRAMQVDDAQRKELEENAHAYFRIAEGYATELGKPLLIVVYGLSGSGKSTLANQIGALLGIDVLNTDVIRRENLGSHDDRTSNHDDATEFGSGIYQPALRAQTYDAMFSRAEDRLQGGLSVILDGTFSKSALRRRAAELARRHHLAAVLVHCQCPTDIATERIVARMKKGNSVSDATPAIYERQRREFEPDPAELDVCRVDTSQDVQTSVEKVFEALRSAVRLSS